MKKPVYTVAAATGFFVATAARVLGNVVDPKEQVDWTLRSIIEYGFVTVFSVVRRK